MERWAAKSPLPENKIGSGLFAEIVPRTGFEPVIPALKGRCPRPLDERGVCNTSLVLLSGFYSIAIALSSEIGPVCAFALLGVASQDHRKLNQIIEWVTAEEAWAINDRCRFRNDITSFCKSGAVQFQIGHFKTKVVLC
jgi:hypothetical protein